MCKGCRWLRHFFPITAAQTAQGYANTALAADRLDATSVLRLHTSLTCHSQVYVSDSQQTLCNFLSAHYGQRILLQVLDWLGQVHPPTNYLHLIISGCRSDVRILVPVSQIEKLKPICLGRGKRSKLQSVPPLLQGDFSCQGPPNRGVERLIATSKLFSGLLTSRDSFRHLLFRGPLLEMSP